MNYFKSEQITRTCIFKNKEIELSFSSQSFSGYKKLLIPAFVILMTAYLLFCIPDWFVFDSYGIFIRNFFVRLLAVILFVIFYFALGRLKNSRSYLLTINAIELGFTIFYIILLSGYSHISFLIKCLDVIIIITLYFLLPNRWINSFYQSLAVILFFTLFCFCNTLRFTENNSYSVGAVYITIAFALNAFNSYRINYYKRSQYYNITILKRLINTDTLTGAFTRAKFNVDLKKQISFSKQTGRVFSIVIFDIDNFKHINDTYGHLEGDNVLAGIAALVTQNKRPKDILTRWGGEEFVVIFPAIGISAALKITERLRLSIASAHFITGEHVTCSFGVTEFQQSDTAVSLLRRADKFMYDAKAAGKNRVVSDIK